MNDYSSEKPLEDDDGGKAKSNGSVSGGSVSSAANS